MTQDRIIQFYEPVLTKTSSGAEKRQYRLLTQPISYAEVKWLTSKSRERDEGKQRVASTGLEMKIRFRSDISQVMIILMEGKYYDILKINPLDRRQWILIEAEEKDNDWTIDLYTP